MGGGGGGGGTAKRKIREKRDSYGVLLGLSSLLFFYPSRVPLSFFTLRVSVSQSRPEAQLCFLNGLNSSLADFDTMGS